MPLDLVPRSAHARREIRPVQTRSLADRAADYAALTGYAAATVAAAAAAHANTPALPAAAHAAAVYGGATAAFIGVRHYLLRGSKWDQDNEMVSAIAATVVGVPLVVVTSAPRRLGPSAMLFFGCGYVGHYLHRYWLRYRLDALELADTPLGFKPDFLTVIARENPFSRAKEREREAEASGRGR